MLPHTARYRLNRGGSRVANNAIWTVTLIRMRSDPCTQQTEAYPIRSVVNARWR